MVRLKIVRYVFILAFIWGVAALALAEEQAAFKEVLPSAVKFSEVRSATHKEILYYRALDNQNKLIGFVFEASGNEKGARNKRVD